MCQSWSFSCKSKYVLNQQPEIDAFLWANKLLTKDLICHSKHRHSTLFMSDISLPCLINGHYWSPKTARSVHWLQGVSFDYTTPYWLLEVIFVVHSWVTSGYKQHLRFNKHICITYELTQWDQFTNINDLQHGKNSNKRKFRNYGV